MTADRRSPPLDARTGKALGRARRSRGWSYRQAAKHTGVAAGHLHAIEHGNRACSLSVAEAIIDAYRLHRNATEVALATDLRYRAVTDAGRDSPYRDRPW